MAALLKVAPPVGVDVSDAAVVRLRHAAQAAAAQYVRARPVLACHWLQDARGQLRCLWDLEVPAIPAVPPS